MLHLCGKCHAWGADLPGGRTGVWLYRGKVRMRKNGATEALIPANNPRKVKETYRELKAKRVKFSEGLTSTSWGKYAILCDPDGNEFGISQSLNKRDVHIGGVFVRCELLQQRKIAARAD